ncbi:MAG TPA: hypothetical protein VN038_05480 [Dyadobacter sp.]|nr:hypothetical protein [Dyadobacter sp.]
MNVQSEMTFEQLVDAIQKLPPTEWKRLKTLVDSGKRKTRTREELLALLLNGPVATEEEIRIIENNRKAINQWGRKRL